MGTPQQQRSNTRTHIIINRVTAVTMASPSTAFSGTIHDSPWSNVKGTRNQRKDNEREGAAGAAAADKPSPFEKRLNETSRAGGGDFDFDNTNNNNNNDHTHNDPFQMHTSSQLSVHQQQQQLTDIESSCRMTTIRCAVHSWLWTDFLFGLVWGVYGLALWRESSHAPSQDNEQSQQPSPPKLVMFVALTVAILLLTRFTAASLSLAVTATDTDTAEFCVGRRCGLLVGAYLAPVLSLGYVTVFSFVAAAGRGAVSRYLHAHHTVLYLPVTWTRLATSTPHRFHGLLTVLLVLAVTECIQWRVYLEYRRYLLQRDVLELEHPPAIATPDSSTRRRHANRPWWWQSPGGDHTQDETLTRNLLSEENDDDNADGLANDPSSGQPRWALPSPFSQGRRRRRNSNNSGNNSRWWGFQWKHHDSIDGHDVRDDGSVDFAEVQEEWASRTEEDPFWWSRPEDHGHAGKPTSNNHTADTSWAKNKDEEEGQRDARNPN
jgi:hypothetical protein